MKISRIRGCLLASTAALLLAAGTVSAQQEQAAQQPLEEQQTAQQAQQFDQEMDVGRGPLPVPQWEYYSHIEPETGVLAWLPFEEVLGSRVIDDETGQPIGEIVGIVRSQEADEFYTVLEPEPDQHIVVPARYVQVRGDREIVLAAPEPLDAMPTWDEVEQEMMLLAALAPEPQPMQPEIQPQAQPEMQMQPAQPQVQPVQPQVQ